MDGDHSAKTMEDGANKAVQGNEMTSGLHETVNQTPAAGDKTTGTGTSMFSKDGAIGSMFNGAFFFRSYSLVAWTADAFTLAADGAIGGTAQKIGGPFDKQGSVGQHFNADGKIGGMVQENLANKKS